MNTYKGFKDLDCYKYGRELRQSIAKIINHFPKEEKYELISQIKRSSRSITANIAEGYGRYTYNDTRHFFIISRGSVTETMEHLITAFDENYISDEVLKSEILKCETVFKLINGFIAYLDKSKKQKALVPNPITNS
jgi:four helix bundle protein